MIVYIQGNLGTGKTALLTFLGWLGYKSDYEIWANYRLNKEYFKKYTYVKDVRELSEVLEYEENINKPRILLADELWSWIDSRTPSKKDARNLINNFLLTSRKRGFHIFHTGQGWTLPDIRLRQLTDYVIFPSLSGVFNEKNLIVVDDMEKTAYGILKAEIWNYLEKRFIKTISIGGKLLYEVFKMYSTHEIVRPKKDYKNS